MEQKEAEAGMSIPDDPIVSCIERTGYPPWMQDDEEESGEPFAVYDPD